MKRRSRWFLFIGIALLSCAASQALRAQQLVSTSARPAYFLLAAQSGATSIYTDSTDHWLVEKAAELLAGDVHAVTGMAPKLIHRLPASSPAIVIIGSVDSSVIISRLASDRKINVDRLRGKWEAYQIQVVEHPFAGIGKALVVTGSDRRGTAYGVFELSKQIGVSPWYWWADVPVKKEKALYVSNGVHYFAPPAVKYRGIFINDEAPAFSGWAREKFGGINHKVYEKVFELLLRLKGNYLWPAMWGNAFNDDDPLDPVLADRYGIVMGTSHHEPMLRAQQEWKRYGKGAWNYETNDSVLRSFWRKGIEHMDHHESIVTVGMRGDGDMPMTQGTAISLLERIVHDQRQILAQVTHKDPSQTPQLWALYKEVQDYYDKGMRVPDDVTLLLCDDNWGNLRKLPRLTDKPRSGGYGIYYHFDYVGGPRNYKWINTNQIERTWDQMHLAYAYGVRNIWIVNVGDLKPMELPISFFLDYAWNPDALPASKLPDYYTQWAAQQFGSKYAKQVGQMLAAYTKFNSRRKPELLSPETYSLTNYNEANRVVHDYYALLSQAEQVSRELPAAYHDAFYELVLHPIEANANLNALYVAVAWNRWYAQQGSAKANAFAEQAKQLFVKDSLISNYYNDTLAQGKWHHMMDQTHIGYTYWQQPPRNKMPEVKYVSSNAASTSGLVQEYLQPIPPSRPAPANNKKHSFIEKDGVVSIEASHFSKAVATPGVEWVIIPNLGKTGSAVEAAPVTAPSVILSAHSPHLEYDVNVKDTGYATIHLYFSPTLDFHNSGIRFAVSIDDEKPQVIDLEEGYTDRLWNRWVADNIAEKMTKLYITKPGAHVIKYWLIDPAAVLQKIVIDLGGLKPSYLGPPETVTNFQTSKLK